MKMYRVTTRGKDGKLEEIFLDAGDRAALFAELNKRGITAIKVEETNGNVKRPKASSGNASSGMFKGIVAAIIVIGGAFATWMMLTKNADKNEASVQEGKSKAIAEVSPSLARAVQDETQEPVSDPQAEERARLKAAYKAMTPEERWEYICEKARTSPLRTEPGTNRIFRTSTEQVMDWIFRCEVGDPPPLLPEIPLKELFHLTEILISDNPISEDDSETVKDAKETVDFAKKEFRAFIMEGGDPEDFLPYYHGQLVQAHNEWVSARKMVIEAVKQEPEIAADFISKVNERLMEKGIKKVTLPQKMLDHYGIELID